MNKIADFFQREYRSMVRYVRSRIDDAADRDAEDIVQDVIVNIFDKADMTIPVEKLAAYVYQSLRNRIVDMFRKRKEMSTLWEVVQEAGQDVEKEAEKKEMLDQVFEAIGYLSEDERAVVIAHEFEERPFRELSDEWDVPVGTLLARKSRALQKIKRALTGN
jgi:RNA polymerase sigma-70 factor (ECF subfamily)